MAVTEQHEDPLAVQALNASLQKSDVCVWGGGSRLSACFMLLRRPEGLTVYDDRP